MWKSGWPRVTRDCSTAELRPGIVGATGVEPITDDPMSSAHQSAAGKERKWMLTAALPLSYSRRNARADSNRQPTVPITHNLRPAENYSAALSGKRVRSVLTNAASALAENISRGENPRRRAKTSASKMRSAVITILGHALSAHWPDHVNCSLLENGKRYGIGHCWPSGPRAPTRSASKCK